MMSLWRKRKNEDIRRLVMDEDDFKIEFSEEGYSLNLSEIAMASHVSPTIRLLAMDLQKNPYARIGDWLRALPETSMSELLELADAVSRGDTDSMEQMMLLTCMLAAAEGTDDLNDLEKIRTQLGMMVNIIAITGLDRKGLVRVHYDNLSLGDDMSSAIIVERLF
jgi:hypothetical protein